MTNEDEVVPTFEGSIVIKATRLPASAAKVLKTNRTRKEAERPKPTNTESRKSTPSVPSSKSSTPTPNTDFLGSFVAFRDLL